jgi:hypothetical protein
VVVYIAVLIAVVALVLIGGAPMVRRTAHAREQEMRARMPGNLDVDVNRDFRRPPREGDLL